MTPDNLMDAAIPKLFDANSVLYLAVGCWDCEGLLQEVGERPCPAEGDDR